MKLLLLILILPQFLHAQDSTKKKLEALLGIYNANGHFNGSVLIAKRGTILLQKGYGMANAENNIQNSSKSIFQIASITKTFTSALVLKLVEQGKLSLTDKLNNYYKGFENGDSITIENLLHHTSGIHNLTETDTTILASDEKHSIDFIRSLKPDFKPGTSWHYSNSGYIILGYIVEKVSGMSYWEAMRKYIFEPLQMNNTGFDFKNLKDRNKTIGYDDLDDTIHHRANIIDSTVTAGAGAIYSTVTDLYRWHQGMQTNKILSKESTDKAFEPSSLHTYGFGWQIDSLYGKKMVSHSGSISGFGSNFASIPADNICIAVLSNKTGSTFDVTSITDKLLAIIYDKPYTLPKKRVPVTIPIEIMKRYIGTYTIAELNLTIEVSIYNNEILIAQPVRDGYPGPTSVLLPLNESTFYDRRDTEIELSFKNDSANTFELVILQKGQTRIAKKVK